MVLSLDQTSRRSHDARPLKSRGHFIGRVFANRRGRSAGQESKPLAQRSCQPPEESKLVTLCHAAVKVASFRLVASLVHARCQPGFGCDLTRQTAQSLGDGTEGRWCGRCFPGGFSRAPEPRTDWVRRTYRGFESRSGEGIRATVWTGRCAKHGGWTQSFERSYLVGYKSTQESRSWNEKESLMDPCQGIKHQCLTPRSPTHVAVSREQSVLANRDRPLNLVGLESQRHGPGNLGQRRHIVEFAHQSLHP